MKKINVFILIGVGGGIYIIIHFYLFFNVINRINNNKQILANIQDVVQLCKEHKILAFIIEAAVLKAMHSGYAAKDPECQLLCLENKMTTLAVMEHQGLDALLADLKKEHFIVSTVEGPDPRLNGILSRMTVPFHILVLRGNHIIHLVIFYERVGSFWWHGSANPSTNLVNLLDAADLTYSQLKFGHHPGAFEKMEVFPVNIDNINFYAPVKYDEFLKQIPQSKFIECDFEQAEQFHKMYGRDISEEALLFRQLAKKVLLKGKRILDGLGVKFWLSSGTCLGWFRQCDIIPYSRDVDFGVFIKDYDYRLISTFSSRGLPLKHQFGEEEDSFELSFQSADVKLDIFFFYEESNYTWNGGTQARTGKKFKYIFPRFSLCWTEFLEMKVRIPCEIQSYIEANYGYDWFSPIKEWDWKSSPSNVQKNGQWLPEDWPRVIQMF